MKEREIKFRAWHKKLFIFIPHEEISSQRSKEIWGRRATLNSLLGNDDYEIMQYTGLKDKNGFELYEGDIVSNEAAEWVVIFNTGCFCGKRIDGSDGTQNIHLALRAIQGKKIIGNIYQNQELLNK